MEVRLLSDHRKDLVAERTRAQNRFRGHLLELCPGLEGSLKRGALEQPRQLDRIEPRLRRMPACARVRVARELLRQIRVLTRQADALERELLAMIKAQCPQLLAETGCGALTAAVLIGHTAGVERFRTDASFARQTGTAPIPCSSGQRDRHRLDRGGDRQLNHALHIIAITRARQDPATRAYLERRGRGQNQEGSAALPQAPPRQALLPAPLPVDPSSTAATRHDPHRQQHRRRRPNAHDLPDVVPAGDPLRAHVRLAGLRRDAHSRPLVTPDRGRHGSATPHRRHTTRPNAICGPRPEPRDR
jgi:Transposase IS116/IS110/IS902 family